MKILFKKNVQTILSLVLLTSRIFIYPIHSMEKDIEQPPYDNPLPQERVIAPKESLVASIMGPLVDQISNSLMHEGLTFSSPVPENLFNLLNNAINKNVTDILKSDTFKTSIPSQKPHYPSLF